jgi:uncharacterized coiled-coil protein SlyX
MTDAKPEYTCIHEDEFQSHSRKITELETRADYKEEMIREMKQEMKELNDKMDKLSTDVNNAINKSIIGDNDIDKRVTSLETTVKVLKWIIGLLFGSGIIWIILTYVR